MQLLQLGLISTRELLSAFIIISPESEETLQKALTLFLVLVTTSGLQLLYFLLNVINFIQLVRYHITRKLLQSSQQTMFMECMCTGKHITMSLMSEYRQPTVFTSLITVYYKVLTSHPSQFIQLTLYIIRISSHVSF